MSIAEKQDAIIEEFELYTDWMDKYERIIELGKELPPIEDALKTDDKLIKGCQSRVWLISEYVDGKIHFYADSDAIITKGLVALIMEVLNGERPEDIAAADLYFIDRIGLSSHLSPTRSNGLQSMVKQMKLYAVAYAQMNADTNKTNEGNL